MSNSGNNISFECDCQPWQRGYPPVPYLSESRPPVIDVQVVVKQFYYERTGTLTNPKRTEHQSIEMPLFPDELNRVSTQLSQLDSKWEQWKSIIDEKVNQCVLAMRADDIFMRLMILPITVYITSHEFDEEENEEEEDVEEEEEEEEDEDMEEEEDDHEDMEEEDKDMEEEDEEEDGDTEEENEGEDDDMEEEDEEEDGDMEEEDEEELDGDMEEEDEDWPGNREEEYLKPVRVDPDQECAICLKNMSDGDEEAEIIHCKHVFHFECLRRWTASHNTCPMCRCELFCI